MRGRDFFGGILLGAIIGAAVGLLLAPQSGEETRELLNEQARDLGDKVKEGSRQFVESSRDVLEQSKTQVTTAGQQVLGKVGDVVSTATSAIKERVKEV